jgi:pimeloyl-ACP methyl ester carboxylesterase
MAHYALIHGASSDSWYWHLVTPELQARGHDVVTPDLPCDDDGAGLSEYAKEVIDAIGKRTGLIVVAQSMAGFTAPLICDRVPVSLLVLLAGMIPLPGEPPGAWWENTGWEEARRAQARREERTIDFDPMWDFLHDVAPDVADEAFARGERIQSGTPFEKPWPLNAWPDVPTKFLLCTKDRFFPPEFMRRVVRDRLGIVPDEIDCGHLAALARPKELVERLEAYRSEFGIPS